MRESFIDVEARCFGAAIAMVCALVSTSHAQTGDAKPQGDSATVASPPTASSTVDDSLIALIPIRGQDEIQRDRDTATARRARAETEIEKAKVTNSRAQAEISTKSLELESIKTNLDLAKKAKNDVAKSQWESKKRLAELEKTLLERRGALRSEEIALAEAMRDEAEATAQAFDAELELAVKREMRGGIGGKGDTPGVIDALARADQDIVEAQQKTLDLQIVAADHRKSVAAKQVEIAKRRKQVLDAQIKLTRGN
jgi:hypothetical protein